MRERREFRDKKGAFKKYNKSAPLGQDPLPGKAIKLFFSCCCLVISHVQLFVTPWTAAQQAFQSFTVSWSLLKFMSIDSEMLYNHLILCHPLLLFLQSFFSTSLKTLSLISQLAAVQRLSFQHQDHQAFYRIKEDKMVKETKKSERKSRQLWKLDCVWSAMLNPAERLNKTKT